MKFTFEKIKAGGNRYPGNIYYNLKIDRKTTKYIIEFISTYNCFNVFFAKNKFKWTKWTPESAWVVIYRDLKSLEKAKIKAFESFAKENEEILN